ncbi:MAG TPA: hypothetical protein VF173_17250 [Thermoanaerobaculia bacterium]|nr:hypothetical protein [Thermoanaerobaculia bacterium]
MTEMTAMPLPPTGPMPFRLLLDEAMRYARRYLRAIWPSVAIPVAIFASAIQVAQALWFARLPELTRNPTNPFAFWNPGVLALGLVYTVVLVIAYFAMQVAAIDALAGRPVSMARAWRFALQWRALGTILMWYACTIASLVCCLVPALYVGPLLSLVPPAMVEEGRFGIPALSRSAELTRYNPSGRLADSPLVKIFLLLLVGLLITYVLAIVVSVPFQIPMWLAMFRQAAAGEDVLHGMQRWVWLQVPAQFLNALASTAVYLYASFGIALMFNDTRGRKEGTDLQASIAAMFPAPAPPPGEPVP